MDSKIQPILCCVGDAVAGRPTQFLMERAFSVAHCDWRVITVEVQQKDFQSALDGMRAMRFTAIRFFSEFQQPAARLLLDQTNPSFSAVTSVMRVGDTWNSWDNQGFGLLSLVSNAAPFSSTLLWLIGNSRFTLSLSNALHTTGKSPALFLWSNSSNRSSESTESSELQPTLLPQSEALLTLKEELLPGNSFTHLVVIGESLGDHLALLKELAAPAEIKLLLATNQLLTRQQVKDAWPSGLTTIFTENDQLIAAEAYDFKRWTGQDADIDLLRDAYDEYSDF